MPLQIGLGLAKASEKPLAITNLSPNRAKAVNVTSHEHHNIIFPVAVNVACIRYMSPDFWQWKQVLSRRTHKLVKTIL